VSDVVWGADRLFGAVRQIEIQLPLLEERAAVVCSALSGTDVSPQMFRKMGGMWLMHLAHQVQALTEPLDEGPLNVLQIPWDAWTHQQAFAQSAPYRIQLGRLLSSSMSADPRHLVPEVVRITSHKVDRRRQAIEGLLRSAQFQSSEILICRPYLKCSTQQRFRAILRTFGWAQWNDLDLSLRTSVTPNMKLRIALADDVESHPHSEAILRLLPLVMPLGYAEGLTDVKSQLASIRRPRLLYSANANQQHLPYQIASAGWSEDGTIVVSHQHGGHQGLDEVHAGEEYEARASDVHYTFGWSDHRENVRPLVTAPPFGLRTQSSDRLLLMTIARSESTYRLQPFCTADHVQAVGKETRQFLSTLTWSAAVVIRGSEEDVAVLQTEKFTSLDDLSIPGAFSASQAALAVHNYLGMSWLETLAMDIPTVCFIPPGIHKFRLVAQPFADALIRVGVLHYSGLEAAKFVNSLRGDPTAWWQSAEVQEARESFVTRYANFSDNWLEAWTEEFERLLG
jgi:putative transferase (TIGR04331 family)